MMEAIEGEEGGGEGFVGTLDIAVVVVVIKNSDEKNKRSCEGIYRLRGLFVSLYLRRRTSRCVTKLKLRRMFMCLKLFSQ